MTGIKKAKYKYLRLRVQWRNWRSSLGEKMIAEKSKLTPYEEKAIRLWKILIRDTDTKMSYNTTGVRQIEKNNVFMTLQESGNSDHIMTLIDITNDRRSLYELHIPMKHADIASDHFDYELDKRMKKVENSKRKIIETDIDKLLEQEEKLLLDRMKK